MKDNNIFKARLNCGAIVILSQNWHFSKRNAKADAMEVYDRFTYKEQIKIKEIGFDEIEIKE